MQNNNIETIAAIATAPGRGGIGIIRISGPETRTIAKHLLHTVPTPRHAHFSAFHADDNSIIDEGLALFFPAPNSFTGEDVLELHGHGGTVVLDMLLQRCFQLGARMARAGEFSERAFLNDKLDLAQAEAIADLIDASSRQAARSALRSLQGEFSKHIHTLTEKLIQLRCYIEAALDFSDEEIDFLADNKILEQLNNIIQKLADTQHTAQQGSMLREGINLVLIGKPNAGKSTLLNCLSGRDSAIVTDIPGTTRDILRETINLDGIPLHLADTAGIRENVSDVIEQEGIKRTQREIETACHVLLLNSVDEQPDTTETLLETINRQLPTPLQPQQIIRIQNKIDLYAQSPTIRTDAQGHTVIFLSAKTGQGIDLLKTHLKSKIGADQTLDGVFMARRRHLDALQRAQTALERGREHLQTHQAAELLAEECRLAQQALSEITGEFHSDDLLGRIFSTFCIGK